MFHRIVRCPSATPFRIVDVASTSVRSVNGSHSNETEYGLCRQRAMTFLAKEVAPNSIAIIVFYKEDYRFLDEFAHTVDVNLHIVYSVQRRDKNIIVNFSTWTGFDASWRFSDDTRRLNVALASLHRQFV
ncbi:hypothetical protein Q1695_012109 [Nippostrongylus brasiliensis]|nr:hypothetical protein Q1695_012109 [Nippostrongylus brasiliensis]